MPRLIAPTGHTLDLPARHLTFGEDPRCDIPLTAGYGLTALHFEIAPGAEGVSFLRDSSGGAGTLINGKPVSISALKEGDIIQAGLLSLRYSENSAPVPAAAPIPLQPARPAALPEPVKLPSLGETITAADAPSTAEAGLHAPVSHTSGRPRPVLIAPRTIRAPAPSHGSPYLVPIACGVLLLLAVAAFCATDPGQRMISPWISRLHQWNTARAPQAKPAPPPSPLAKKPEAAVAPDAPVIPQTSHEEITRRILTERTQTLLYADLRQLIPCYNVMASQQGLPSQRELSESFRKSYGAIISPFEQLSLLQSDTQDEFLLILSAKTVLDVEKIIGQPLRATPKGQPVKPQVFSLKAGSRSLNAALYDPFTLLLGSPRAIAKALQPNSGPQLREARCMFPETAHRNPGALIMVKRVNLPPSPSEGDPATAFETVVTNLFLKSGPSTLTLVRNPDIREQTFVDAAAPALKQQAAALAPALGTDAKSLSDLPPGEINLTINEASISLPGGATLISSSLEKMARSFVHAAPSMSTILQAQDAVMKFNGARATGSEPALKASTPREALELLNEGIRGSGRFSGTTFQISSPESDLESLSSLLAIDSSVGLVYRPDMESLSGAALDLALKARNYRNAELLVTLWEQLKLEATSTETPATAARRILAWANSPAGRQQRSMMGLPSLTADELKGAIKYLVIEKGDLIWKPGEANYRMWIRIIHPDPRRDAERLASLFNRASAAGAIPASASRDLKAALSLITSGVNGRGDHAGTNFKLDSLTPNELSAAAALLVLEDGKMKLTATAANTALADKDP